MTKFILHSDKPTCTDRSDTSMCIVSAGKGGGEQL